jgi:hypothetical protein
MAKITITISEEALSKIEVQSNALDITPNTYIKQVMMQHVNNSNFAFFTSEQRLALQDFSSKQSQLLNIMKKIDEEYLKQGKSFPMIKINEYLKSYNSHFKSTIERLSNVD